MSEIEIEVYVDGKLHGARHWQAVPRVGDHMLVKGMVESKPDALSAVRVTRVLWGGNFHSRAFQDFPIVRLDTEVEKHDV